MLRRVLVLAALALLLAPAAAAAQERSAFCSPSGDFCSSASKRGGILKLRLDTFAHRGRVRTCVTAPDGATTCRSFRLRSRGGGLVGFAARWTAHFPNRGPGRYRVRFTQGAPIGPALGFTVGG